MVLLVIGVLALNGTVALSQSAAFLLAAFGVALAFIVPRALLRRWRSPE